MRKEIVEMQKLQSIHEKILRYYQIFRYYGPKLTFMYYLTQQSNKQYYDYCKNLLLNFVLKLRKEAQIYDSSDEMEECALEFPKIVWTMWQQGEDQMPETVKASIKTIKDFAERNNCELILLTDENLHNFIEIPNDITEKYENKELSAAHYSDIIRFSLLYQYGGIWMDATLYISPYATLEMFEGEFFTMNHPPIRKDQMERDVGDFKWSGFFLAGKKGKSYFKNIRDLYLYFVRKFPVFIHYLMMDYFILSEYDSNPVFRTLVDQLPILAPAERVWFLRDYANELFDEQEWDNVLRTTPILKTTYKINEKELVPQSYLYKLYYGELD